MHGSIKCYERICALDITQQAVQLLSVTKKRKELLKMNVNRKKYAIKRNSMKVGLIGDFTQDTANKFIEDFNRQQNLNAEVVFHDLADICPACVSDFINENGLSILFIDCQVTIGGACICEAYEEIALLSQRLKCQIYLVENTSNVNY